MARRRFYGKNREQRISGEICRESCFQITSEPILKYIRICYIDDGAEHDFVHKLEEKDTAKAVLKVLHELPEPYREVFYLHVFGEVALVEIAELFGKSPSWAGVTYYRAKQKISDNLNAE